jgi:hypothetical protein
MPLPDLPRNPHPTGAELAIHQSDLPLAASSALQGSHDPRRGLAILRWRVALANKHPDALLVPIATAIRQFPEEIATYDEYVASPLWVSIREKVLAAAGTKCTCCPRPATEVHHRDYRPRVLRGDDLAPLVALCRDCHHMVDKLPNGRSREVWTETEAILAEMVRREDARLAATEVLL